jgi:2-dehydro-3-deoxygalactonokinase
MVCGELPRAEVASYLRGLLIGAEIADALAFDPGLSGSEVKLLGNGALGKLYVEALAALGITARAADARAACIAGFLALHRMRVAA